MKNEKNSIENRKKKIIYIYLFYEAKAKIKCYFWKSSF